MYKPMDFLFADYLWSLSLMSTRFVAASTLPPQPTTSTRCSKVHRSIISGGVQDFVASKDTLLFTKEKKS